MKLYHFCSKHHIKSILRDGLTLGCVPISLEPVKVAPGFQWLTKNKKFKQSWCQYTRLPYNRNDFRITVSIPKSNYEHLIPWIRLLKKLVMDYPELNVLNEFGDPWNWYVYKGTILPF